MSGWKERKISEFCEITRGGSPRPIHDFLTEYGTPWVKISDATESCNRYIEKTKEFIKPEGEAKSRVVNPGDFILSNSATPGLPRFMKIRACIHDGWLLIRKIKNVDELFLYYLLLNEREALLAQGNGSIFINLKTEILKDHKVLLPPLPEQKAIAAVLSSLDDKIDLLHRQNKTLEAMAETLFRQWFVEEADDGWEEGKLGDLIELIYGKALKDEIRTGAGFSVVGSSGVVGYHSEYLVTGPGIVIGRKGTLGKATYLNENFFPIDTTYFVKSKSGSIGMLFEYFLLKTIAFDDMNSDSAVPGLNRDIALSTELKIPPLDLIQKFNSACISIMDKKESNTKQIRTLEKLRDTLLPKLMSGEVRVEL